MSLILSLLIVSNVIYPLLNPKVLSIDPEAKYLATNGLYPLSPAAIIFV